MVRKPVTQEAVREADSAREQIPNDHNGDLDGADGFPRYFFGSEDEVKVQMETWLSRRAAYRKALQQ